MSSAGGSNVGPAERSQSPVILANPPYRRYSTAERESHSHDVEGGRGHWWTDRLWAESANLPIEEVAIDSIAEFDMDCWFHGRAPTCRQVAEHARRINAADLNHPVILAADGALMDGGHRIAKAYLLGRRTVPARRFRVDPDPDWIVASDASRVGRSGDGTGS